MLASVAFDAGIISATFFTTLVLTAVLTSQACGVWLDFVLRKGWPLLASEVRWSLEDRSSSPHATPAVRRHPPVGRIPVENQRPDRCATVGDDVRRVRPYAERIRPIRRRRQPPSRRATPLGG